jgi:fatty acid desaturase
MADPIARRLGIGFRLIRPAMIAGLLAALIAAGGLPTVVPLACGMTWTRTGGAFIFMPDCSHQSPPSQPPPASPGAPPPAAPPIP